MRIVNFHNITVDLVDNMFESYLKYSDEKYMSASSF